MTWTYSHPRHLPLISTNSKYRSSPQDYSLSLHPSLSPFPPSTHQSSLNNHSLVRIREYHRLVALSSISTSHYIKCAPVLLLSTICHDGRVAAIIISPHKVKAWSVDSLTLRQKIWVSHFKSFETLSKEITYWHLGKPIPSRYSHQTVQSQSLTEGPTGATTGSSVLYEVISQLYTTKHEVSAVRYFWFEAKLLPSLEVSLRLDLFRSVVPLCMSQPVTWLGGDEKICGKSIFWDENDEWMTLWNDNGKMRSICTVCQVLQ